MTVGIQRVGIVHFGRYPDIRVAKFAETLAGSGRHVVVLARELPALDQAPHPYAAQVEARRAHLDGRLEVREVAPRLPRAATMPYHPSPVWRRAVRRLLDEGCDLLVVRDIPLLPAATAAARPRGVPVVLDVAENYPAVLREWRRWEGRRRAVVNGVLRNAHLADRLERRAVRAADRVVVVVEEHARRIAALRGRDDVVVIENTPVLDDLPPAVDAPRDAAELTVTHTGEVHFYRGIDTVIEAARLLRRRGGPAVRWRLAGTGVVEGELRRRAERAGVADVVDFLGWQPEPLREAAAADVGVIPPHDSPHYAVTMPNKLYEFMALGKPVVVSDVAPMRRVVTSTGCGRTFRAGDAADLAQVVATLATDPEQRRRMGAAGRAAVADRYSWKVDAERLLALVDGLTRQQ